MVLVGPEAMVGAGHPAAAGAELPVRAHGCGQAPLGHGQDSAVVVAHVALWPGSAEERRRHHWQGLAIAEPTALSDPLVALWQRSWMAESLHTQVLRRNNGALRTLTPTG